MIGLLLYTILQSFNPFGPLIWFRGDDWLNALPLLTNSSLLDIFGEAVSRIEKVCPGIPITMAFSMMAYETLACSSVTPLDYSSGLTLIMGERGAMICRLVLAGYFTLLYSISLSRAMLTK